MALDVAVVSEYSLEYYISNIIAFERRVFQDVGVK